MSKSRNNPGNGARARTHALCANIARSNNTRRCGTNATEETPPRRKVRAMFFTQASAKAAAERRAQRTTLHLHRAEASA